ncbi:MAG: MBL fold metallo-hydrolase [Clostridiaceae bacterium]|nr:MBL fold metallo-hydrolase [Clostridiaceae bacterium]
MKVLVMPVGSYEANCYIIKDETSQEIAVIDPGANGSLLIKEVEKLQGRVKYILLTHAHADHTGAVRDLNEHFKAPVYLSQKDEALILKGEFMFGKIKVDGYIKDGDSFKIGNLEIKCIETPGHTPGGFCFFINEYLFSGDTLFAQSIGRTDLSGGNFETIIQSIKDKLFTLPEETKVFPGHGAETSIKNEKKYNPFF